MQEGCGVVHRVQLYFRLQLDGLVGAADDAPRVMDCRGSGSLGRVPPRNLACTTGSQFCQAVVIIAGRSPYSFSPVTLVETPSRANFGIYPFKEHLSDCSGLARSKWRRIHKCQQITLCKVHIARAHAVLMSLAAGQQILGVARMRLKQQV